jgi:hypothetical protein
VELGADLRHDLHPTFRNAGFSIERIGYRTIHTANCQYSDYKPETKNPLIGGLGEWMFEAIWQAGVRFCTSTTTTKGKINNKIYINSRSDDLR